MAFCRFIENMWWTVKLIRRLLHSISLHNSGLNYLIWFYYKMFYIPFALKVFTSCEIVDWKDPGHEWPFDRIRVNLLFGFVESARVQLSWDPTLLQLAWNHDIIMDWHRSKQRNFWQIYKFSHYKVSGDVRLVFVRITRISYY